MVDERRVAALQDATDGDHARAVGNAQVGGRAPAGGQHARLDHLGGDAGLGQDVVELAQVEGGRGQP